MRAQIVNSAITIDVQTLLESLSDADRLNFIESLSCADNVIAHVTAQILDGWTENGCHGSLLVTATEDPVFGLDKAKREVARRAGEVAASEIKRLEDALKWTKKKLTEAEETLFGRRSE